MKVAVILVNFNGISDTIECIESLHCSKIPLKIVVVDNDSNDNEALRISQKYPNVEVIHLNQNLGFTGGNNVGIQWALGKGYEYIALLNNDTIIDNNLFSALLEFADKNTVVVPYMYYHSAPNTLWFGGGKINRWTGNVNHIYKQQKDNKTFYCDFVTGCCFLAHRSIWENVGLLNDDYFMYNEDSEFSIRLQKSGIKIRIIPSAKLWHKVGRSSGGRVSLLSSYYVTRNRLYLLKTHKDFFKPSAYLFSLITRYIWALRMLISGKKDIADAFIQGIKDSKKNVMGKKILNFTYHK
jgi:GT2 family glycosyltransferase